MENSYGIIKLYLLKLAAQLVCIELLLISTAFASEDFTNEVGYNSSAVVQNGYSASLYFYWGSAVLVKAHRDVKITGVQRPRVKAIDGPPYLVPTNGFCGSISLISSNNFEVPILNPSLLSSNSYPRYLEWTALLFGDPGRYSGPVPGYNGLFEKSGDTQGEICVIHLKEIYSLTNKGDYKLIVWPKIYKRTETNDNVYQRIDLAPVSTTVHVN